MYTAGRFTVLLFSSTFSALAVWSWEIFACSVLQLLCTSNRKKIHTANSPEPKEGKKCIMFSLGGCVQCVRLVFQEIVIVIDDTVIMCFGVTRLPRLWKWLSMDKPCQMFQVNSSSLNVKRRGIKHLNGLRIPVLGVGFAVVCPVSLPPSFSLPSR